MPDVKQSPYRVVGVDSSPYTAKVRAVMRYRHIPHQWVCRFPQMLDETSHVRPAIMPMVRYPDGEYRTDSTPILLDLEHRHPGQRSIVPDDPGHAFLSHLLEDMADEWLSKCLFWLRFATLEAGEFAAGWVMDDARFNRTHDEIAADKTMFRERQVARMEMVGVTTANSPVVEASYAQVLDIMETVVANGRFLFGTRPALADFGMYAQLRTIGTDPVGLGLMRARAPRTESWLRRLDDGSGVEGEWSQPTAAVESLLRLAGSVYLPYLDANATAKGSGEEMFEVELGGTLFRARPFGYQVKCLNWLRDGLRAVPPDARARIDPLLDATGCLASLTA